MNIELFKRLIKCIKKPNQEILKMSMNHVHAEGIFSLVLDGDEPGILTRVFIADKELKPFDVQYHTHTYPITLTTVKGDITHHTAIKDYDDNPSSLVMDEYIYKSFLNGGDGLKWFAQTKITCHDYKLPPGSSINLSTDDFHTMSCSVGSMWIIEEHGFEKEASRVLGIPFIVDGLYHEPGMFQINDKCQIVLKELKRIVEAYELL